MASLPFRHVGDDVIEFYDPTEKPVAMRDQPLLLHRPRDVRVHARGRSAVDVAALVGDDVAEVGDRPRCEVIRELLERDHVREVGGVLEVGEIHDAVVLRNVHRVGVRDAVALVRVAIAAIPG